MAVQKNISITLGGTDLSSSLRALEVNEDRETLPGETHGDDYRWFEPGMKIYAITAEFKQDYSSGGVDDVITSLADTFSVVIKPDSGSVSTSNPSRTATMMIENYNPHSGTVGDQRFCTVQMVLAADPSSAIRATA